MPKSAKHASISSYISSVERIWKTGKATEHSYRGELETLLKALLPGFGVINEAKRIACGAPDYIIMKSGLPVSFVEAKDIGDADLDGKKRTGNKEQFDRYKAALPVIAFTDYLDFRLYLDGKPTLSARIAEEVGGGIRAIPANFDAFLDIVDALGNAKPMKIASASQLAKMMAAKARILQIATRRFLETAASASTGATPATSLEKLMADFRRVLMPNVDFEEFSDIYAQTVTYGMFAARLHAKPSAAFTRYTAAALIPKSNPFLHSLFSLLALTLDPEIEWVVDDIAELFAAASVCTIMAGYGKATSHADPMIHFYEDFLAAYDAGQRKDRGVWYTPIAVVKFIVRAVDEILQTRFGLGDGLADASKTEITVEEFTSGGKKLVKKKKKEVHRVQVLDPATGTGTFLAECIRQIHAKFAASGNGGKWPGYVRDDLLPRLNGFELLMASYTMAHVKLDLTLSATGYTHTTSQRFNIFLTDSLTPEVVTKHGLLFALALGEEAEAASFVKRDCPVMVVMGNPPYNGESGNKHDFIMRLMKDYKKEPGGKVKLQERNPKWLNDDYVKFLRLAENYVERNGSGIIAFINPHGFLDNPTFRGMRWKLMQTFDEIYVLNLHGNAKKKEVAPDGSKDDNVFNIMQGVSINIFVKTTNAANSRSAAVAPAKVYYADLWGSRKTKFDFLDSNTLATIPYKELTPTHPMFFFVPKDTAGEKEYNKGFSLKDIFLSNSVSVVTASDKILVSRNVKTLAQKIYHEYGETANNDIIVPYAYRPFDTRYIYFDTEKIERPREKIMTQFLLGNNIALLSCRQLAGNIWSHTFVSENIVDDNCVSNKSRERGYVFPLYLYQENLGTVEKVANLNSEIVEKIEKAINGKATPEEIFDYIYAVLHTPEYREKYKEFLKVDFPRIPYPKDAKEFERLAKTGGELRLCHLMKDPPPSISETTAAFPVSGANTVEKVEFSGGGAGGGKVYINDAQHFANVPEAAWNMFIGGYQPAQKWLKDRRGRTLSQADLTHYQRIILALIRTASLMSKL